jgi:ketosteroid isomerase-like protein
MRNRLARPLLVAAFLAVAFHADAKTLAPSALETWLASYGAAWESRDAAAVGRLFTAAASYREMPFDAPKEGRAAIEEYWRTVTADQRDVKFESKVLAVKGNVGIAHWSAKFRLESTGAIIELDGIFELEFGAGGQCTSLREWWHVRTR